MNALLSFIMVTSNSSDSVSSQIQTIVDDFISTSTSVSLFYDDADIWRPIDFAVPVTFKDVRDDSAQVAPVQAYIIDFRNLCWNITTFAKHYRNADVRYIFLTSDATNADVLGFIEERRICHHLVVKVEDGKVSTSNLTRPCHGMGAVPLDAADGCKSNVSCMDFPPAVLVNGDKLGGLEALMIKTSADKIGIKLNPLLRNEDQYGSLLRPEDGGLEGEVATGTSFAAIGSLFPFHYRDRNADVMWGCHSVSIRFIAPAGAGESKATWVLALISELTPSVWFSTLIVYLSIVTISYKEFKDRSFLVFHVFALVLGVGQKEYTTRFVYIMAVFFGIIITTCYTATMSSFLTKPAPAPELRTLEQMTEKVTVYGPDRGSPILLNLHKSDPTNIAFKRMSDDYIRNNTATIEDYLLRITTKRDIAVSRHYDTMLYNLQQYPEFAKKVHPVEQEMMSYRTMTLLRKHSCLSERVQDIYNRICESGIQIKWRTDLVKPQAPSEVSGPKPMTLEHLKGAIYLLLMGWFISFAVFVGENSVQLKTFAKKLALRKNDQWALATNEFKSKSFKDQPASYVEEI